MEITPNSEIAFKANYKITKASNALLAKVYCDILGIDPDKFYTKWLAKDGGLIPIVQTKIAKDIKNYVGRYSQNLQQREGHNLVPDQLRNAMATLISGTSVSPTFKSNYCAMGDDATSPSNSDTTLGNETIRGLRSNRFAIDNVAYLDKFWSSAEVGGNSYQEIGVFVDGTAVQDSGYLLSHININETMSSTETLTVNVTISIA